LQIYHTAVVSVELHTSAVYWSTRYQST